MLESPLRLLAVVAASAAISSSAQPSNPMVREGVTEKISAHVYVIPDGNVSLVPNVGIIVGSRATLVIDTGLGLRNGQAVLREVGKVSHHVDQYLATTHFHPEHDLGGMAFPAATKMVRSADQQKDIAEFGLQLAKAFSSRSPMVAELLKGADFRPADITFEREYTVDLGDVRVRLIAMGANHTRGDTAMLVEPDGVLFSGDVVMRALPSFASSYSSIDHWLESLDELEKLHPKQIVPSHGLKGDITLIAHYRAFLQAVQSRTAEQKKQGLTLDETLPVVTADLQAKYPDRARLAGAIRQAYAEAR